MVDDVVLDPEDIGRFRFWVETRKDGVKVVRSWQKGKGIILSRLLMNPNVNEVVDHINGDRLDNRKANLRVCTQSQNLQNRKMNKNNSAGFKGVAKSGRKWRARITFEGVRRCLGSFDSAKEAHQAYCFAATKLHKRFANFG